MSLQQKNNLLQTHEKKKIYLLSAKALVLLGLFFLTQNPITACPYSCYSCHFMPSSSVQDSFRLQLFHASSGASLEQVNVFNNCDFSSTQSQKNGTVAIDLVVGECCDFTFSKSNFSTKEITVCANQTPNGVQLSLGNLTGEATAEFNFKGASKLLDAPMVFKDTDQDIFISSADQQPFTGQYKGLTYQNGKLKPADFCCTYQIEENELLDRNLSIVKKGIEEAETLKISLQSEVNFRVKGLVLEETHEFPIEEARVILVNENNEKDCQIRLTNLDGIFDFSLRKNECYQLWVEKKNFTQVGSPIQICTNKTTASQSFEFNIFLKQYL